MNKKADEKYLSMWWIFVLGVIAGAIVIAVLVYYSGSANVNLAEADILSERIMDCIFAEGNMNEDILKEDFNIFKECNLNKRSFENNGFYFNIKIYGDLLMQKEIIAGDNSYEADCEVKSKVYSKHYPACSRKQINFIFNGTKLSFEVLAAVNNKGGKIGSA